jgi:hypothetical protein
MSKEENKNLDYTNTNEHANGVDGVLTAGFPTHSIDINGKQICLGDKVTYDFDDNTLSFVVVFENNAFRKKYPRWNKTIEKPLLEYGFQAEKMRLKVVKSTL